MNKLFFTFLLLGSLSLGGCGSTTAIKANDAVALNQNMEVLVQNAAKTAVTQKVRRTIEPGMAQEDEELRGLARSYLRESLQALPGNEPREE